MLCTFLVGGYLSTPLYLQVNSTLAFLIQTKETTKTFYSRFDKWTKVKLYNVSNRASFS